MGRGPVMAQKKEKNAQAKGKIFTLHAKLIALAAQRGGDPSLNPALFEAIAKAKKDNVPNDNIDRAVKKGSGASGEGSVESIIYEGYAPGGVAIVVKCLTDNRNRTAANMRHIFSHAGGSLAETWAVTAFAFDFLGKIEVTFPESISSEKQEEMIIESGAEDYVLGGERALVWTARTDLAAVTMSLKSLGSTVLSSTLTYRAKLWNEVSDFDNALALYTLESELDEDDDVEEIWHNADLSDELADAVQKKLESTRFHT